MFSVSKVVMYSLTHMFHRSASLSINLWPQNQNRFYWHINLKLCECCSSCSVNNAQSAGEFPHGFDTVAVMMWATQDL